MATKKKSRKPPQKKSKKPAAKKQAKSKKLAKKRPAPKKSPKKKAALKAKVTAKTTAAKTITQPKKSLRRKTQIMNTVDRADEGLRPRSGGQSGDLQGLSGFERADSESVDELLEEGNSFEAGVVKGVEDAGGADEQEVHTHQVPEDDVPEEYLDEK